MSKTGGGGNRFKPSYFDRLFFAVVPDEQTATHIESIAGQCLAEHGIRGKLAAADRFHVSLNLFGNYREGLPPTEVARACAVAEAVRVTPFDISLNRIMTFQRNGGKNQPLVMLVDQGKTQLRALLLALLSGEHGISVEKKAISGFNPHLTLLYGDQTVAHSMEPISWVVRDFVLVHSLVGRTQYKILGRWTLQAHTKDLFGE